MPITAGDFVVREVRWPNCPYFAVECSVVTTSGGAVVETLELHGWLDNVTVDTSDMTTLWDLTLEDSQGLDLLSSLGLNRATGSVQTFWVRDATAGQKNNYVRLDGCYRFRIANGGNAKSGLVLFRLFDLSVKEF